MKLGISDSAGKLTLAIFRYCSIGFMLTAMKTPPKAKGSPISGRISEMGRMAAMSLSGGICNRGKTKRRLAAAPAIIPGSKAPLYTLSSDSSVPVHMP